MKRTAKVILFLAVAAITFGGLSRLSGRGYGCGDFRNRHDCGPGMQPPAHHTEPSSTKSI